MAPDSVSILAPVLAFRKLQFRKLKLHFVLFGEKMAQKIEMDRILEFKQQCLNNFNMRTVKQVIFSDHHIKTW